MREELASVEEFVEANSQTRCINLVRTFVQHDAIARLSEVASFWRVTFEEATDLEDLKTTYMVRYKQNSNLQSGWQYPGSSNFTVDEYVKAIQEQEEDPAMIQKILELEDSLRKGLSEDITLTGARDESLKARILVDGNQRATALVLLLKNDPLALRSIVPSRYRVQMLELRSRWAHVIYPCDFLELCARFGRTSRLREGNKK